MLQHEIPQHVRGTFRLEYAGVSTATLGYNASARAVESALSKLPAMGRTLVTRTSLQNSAYSWSISFLEHHNPLPLVAVGDELYGTNPDTAEEHPVGIRSYPADLGSGVPPVPMQSTGTLNVNILNVNERPICEDSTGDMALSVAEGLHKDTELTNTERKLHFADPEKDSQTFSFSFATKEAFIRRRFRVMSGRSCGIGYGSEKTNSHLLVNGIQLQVGAQESCSQLCVARSDCKSWEHLSSTFTCYLYNIVPVCFPGETLCVMHKVTASLTTGSDSLGSTCGYIDHWRWKEKHSCNISFADQVGYMPGVQNIDLCVSACVKQSGCFTWEYLGTAEKLCTLFGVMHDGAHFIVSKSHTCGYRKEGEQNATETFQLDRLSGKIYATGTSQIDFENFNYYLFTVFIADPGGLFCEGHVVVNVRDVNEPPKLLRASYNFSLFEHIRAGREYENYALDTDDLNTVPMTILAEDEDKDSVLKFSVLGSSPFHISTCADCENGQISIGRGIMDYESEHSAYHITVLVTDSGNPPLSSSTADVIISVRNSNEVPAILICESLIPNCVGGNVYLPSKKPFVLENSPAGTNISNGHLKFWDPDHDFCTWSIPKQYPSLTRSSTLENPCGTANSPPCENWDRHRVHILSDGQLVVGLVGHAALDHEESRSLVTVVRITDSGGLFSESTVEIQIEDENERPMFNPKIQEVIYVVAQSIPGSNVGVPLLSMVTDPEDDNLSFEFFCGVLGDFCKSYAHLPESVIPIENIPFSISSATGQIRVADSAPNVSLLHPHKYQLGVLVKDSSRLNCTSNSMECGGSSNSIRIETVSVNVPPLLSDKTVVVFENMGNVSHIIVTANIATVFMKHALPAAYSGGDSVWIYTRSGDTGFDGKHNILPAPPSTLMKFSIATSGLEDGSYASGLFVGTNILSSNHATDANLRCFHGGGLACDSTCNVSITPCFDICGAAICNIETGCEYENRACKKITYSILESGITPEGARDAFAIDSDTGALRTKTGFDFEGNFGMLSTWDKTITVTIVAYDNGETTQQGSTAFQLSSSSVVKVILMDSPESPVIYPVSTRVNEGETVGTSFVRIVASDQDALDKQANALSISVDGSLLPFSLAAATVSASPIVDSGVFALNHGFVSRAVTISSTPVINRELKSQYQYMSSVRDSYGLTSNSTVRIIISDVNERPCIASHSEFSIDENSPLGSKVGEINGFDPDFSSVLTFSIVGTSTIFFSLENQAIEPFVGILRIVSSLDYEVYPEHIFDVAVTDGSLVSVSGQVIVNVIDVNDILINDVSLFSADGILKNTGMDTAGGDIIRFRGSNLAYIGRPNVFSVEISNSDIASSAAALTVSLISCTVEVSYGLGNEQVDCIAPVGHGNTFGSIITITRPGGGKTWSYSLGSSKLNLWYSTPIITAVTGLNGSTLETAGGDTILLQGRNFGPSSVRYIDVEYGPMGTGLCASNCRVVVSHTDILCISRPGVGKNLKFTVWIGFDRRSLPSSATLSYNKPSVRSVYALSGRLDTRGSGTFNEDVIIVVGSNFGPVQRVVDGCFGLSSLVQLGVTAQYGLNLTMYTSSCHVSIDHVEVRCSWSPGIGHDMGFILESGGQRSDIERRVPYHSTNATVSYFAPVVTRVYGPGSFEASTTGGQSVYIDGNYFGPLSTSPFLFDVTYGSFPQAWNASSPFYPPYNAHCILRGAHTQLYCTTSPGTGKNHSWKISVAGQTPILDNGFIHAETSYGAPIIFRLDDILYNPMSAGLTTGGEVVVITGRNFGPLGHPGRSLIEAWYGGKKGEGDILFHASSCSVTIAHTEIRCLSGPGAGAVQPWQLRVDGQISISPSVSYGAPVIYSLSGVGAFQANGNGGELVIINGENFGPPERPEFFDGVTYGETGLEYHAACSLLSHQQIQCNTSAGIGNLLYWRVRVKGQANDLTSDAVSSYAAPWILQYDAAIDTDMTESNPLRFVGTNLGVSDRSATILMTKIHDGVRTELTVTASAVLPGGLHEVFINAPQLDCKQCSSTFKLVLKTRSSSGRTQVSGGDVEQDIYVTFKPPKVSFIHVADGLSGNTRRLTLVGQNFGFSGYVFKHSSVAPPEVILHAIDGVAPPTNTYVLSYSHKKVEIEYHGTTGAISLQRAQRQTTPMAFNQLSPSIVEYGNSSGILYVKSDQLFTDIEKIFYGGMTGSESTYPLSAPDVCISGVHTASVVNDGLPGCQFFSIDYNPELTTPGLLPYSASFPLVFETSGFDANTSLGYLTFICKYCDKGETVIVTLGEGNHTALCEIDRGSRKPEILLNPETGQQTSFTRLSCRIPAFQGRHVPVVVSRGLSQTLPFYVSYRPPLILILHTSTKTVDCYAAFFQSNAEICEEVDGCVWDYASTTCLLAVETSGCVLHINGKHFGTRDAAAFFGSVVGQEETAANLHILFHSETLISAKIPPLSGNQTTGVIWVVVSGQTSATTDGNRLSKEFRVKYGKPRIRYISLPENARTAGGSIFEIFGENFGRKELENVFVTVGRTKFIVLHHNHTFISVQSTPGQGTSLSITVTVVGAVSKPAKEQFSYNAPIIYSLDVYGRIDGEELDPFLHGFPTSGKWSNGSDVVITLTGDNFGTPGSASMWFGHYGSHLVPTKPYYFQDHTQLQFVLPEGEGTGHRIHVEVYGQQTESSALTTLEYARPKIVGAIYPDGLMTSGCGKYDKFIQPGENGLRCISKASFQLIGKNFGRTPLVEVRDSSGSIRIVSIVSSSHSLLQLTLPRGMGQAHVLILAPGDIWSDKTSLMIEAAPGVNIRATKVYCSCGKRPDGSLPAIVTPTGTIPPASVCPISCGGNPSYSIYDRASNIESFTYDKPTLIEVRTGPTIGSAMLRNQFDARGGLASGDRLFFFGDNYGDEESPLSIFLQDTQTGMVSRCSDAQYHGRWINSGQHGYWVDDLDHPWVNPGLPYLSCLPVAATVGSKVAIIEVAMQNVSFKGFLLGRCKEGFYGRLGERCVECWNFINTEAGSGTMMSEKDKKIYAVECTGHFVDGFGTEEPIAKPGFTILPPQECYVPLRAQGCNPDPLNGLERIPPSCLISVSERMFNRVLSPLFTNIYFVARV
jgi:hypothetical protein